MTPQVAEGYYLCAPMLPSQVDIGWLLAFDLRTESEIHLLMRATEPSYHCYPLFRAWLSGNIFRSRAL